MIFMILFSAKKQQKARQEKINKSCKNIVMWCLMVTAFSVLAKWKIEEKTPKQIERK